MYLASASEGESRLHAFDRATGANRWSVQPGLSPAVGLVMVGGAVVVAGRTVSVYGRDGTELGPDPESARSPAVYDRVRANDSHVLLTTRPDRPQRQTVILDRQTWTVNRTTETFVPVIGAVDESLYIVSDIRRTRGRENSTDTRIRRVTGAGLDPLAEVWVHGTLRSVDGDRLYTLLQTTDTALGGLYAYDLPSE